MEYIVLGSDGKEYGPVDQETLCKWIEHGRVFKETQIRNALMKKWNLAGDLPSLTEAFEANEALRKKEPQFGEKLLNSLMDSHSTSKSGEPKKNTAFVHKYKPKPAHVLYRIYAFLTDAFILSTVGITLFFLMASLTGTWVNVSSAHFKDIKKMEKQAEEQAEKFKDTSEEPSGKYTESDIRQGKDKENKHKLKTADKEKDPGYDTVEEKVKFPLPVKFKGTYYFFVFVFILFTMFYYGIGLGVFAQTIGMWYWGLIIVKGYKDEAFPLRTFAYAILSVVFAPITPFVVLFNPIHRSVQGYLTGTRIISVTAQAEA